jgi:hypothetical protein
MTIPTPQIGLPDDVRGNAQADAARSGRIKLSRTKRRLAAFAIGQDGEDVCWIEVKVVGDLLYRLATILAGKNLVHGYTSASDQRNSANLAWHNFNERAIFPVQVITHGRILVPLTGIRKASCRAFASDREGTEISARAALLN